MRARRVALLTAMSVVTLNIWTGAPLLGLWVGSRVVGDRTVTMGAIALVAFVMGATCLGLVRLLGALSAQYDDLTGRPPQPRQVAPWLRSMRGERPHHGSDETRLQPFDYVLVASVAVCCAAFEIWFFFFAGSSIGHG
jgi:hypothetical protein